MNKRHLFIILIFVFVLLLGTTVFVSFSGAFEEQAVVVKSITPVYENNGEVFVENDIVTFNDKNQVVEYNVVLENIKDYDVRINNIELSLPTEEFLTYEVKNIKKDDVLSANTIKELTIYLETTGIEGWGRNFVNELTANISFEKVVIPVKHPVKHPTSSDNTTDKDDDVALPEKPAVNSEDLINKSDKLEIIKVTNDIIEFKTDFVLETDDKVGVWLYSDPIFLGYFDIVEKDGIKQIIGLEDALRKTKVKAGDHNIVIVSAEKETIGYLSVYINEDKELLEKTIQDSVDKEEIPKGDDKVENPYTSDNKLFIVLVFATSVTGLTIIVVSKNKLSKYIVFLVVFGTTSSLVSAQDLSVLSIKTYVSFKSQNVMRTSYDLDESGKKNKTSYWKYAQQIKNFYIKNETVKISEYEYKFDVTESGNGRVNVYLVKNQEDSNYFDAYLIADGIIYPNKDAYIYFQDMKNLDVLDNLAGFDTSEVTNMRGMFASTGYNSASFTLDVSSFDTSNVTNMSAMFQNTGYSNEDFEIDLSNFDTSNVEDMHHMFHGFAYNSKKIRTLDLRNFDTSKVTDMSAMFQYAAYSSEDFSINVSSFDTSNVTDMSVMFNSTGYSSKTFELDVSGFNTSRVTSMLAMFQMVGQMCDSITLDVSNFDTSNVTDMSFMFNKTGFNSSVINIDTTNFDTSKLVNAGYMFNRVGANGGLIKTSITIMNPNIEIYDFMFYDSLKNPDSYVKLNYISSTERIVDAILSDTDDTSHVLKGNLIVDVDNLSIGDEIHISGEKFNVISQTDDTITMLAQYNLGKDYRQSTTNILESFSDSDGWQYTPGPKEIDIQKWSSNPKTYVNSYIDYLVEELGTNAILGDLITLKELEVLGCTVPSDYSWESGGWNCYNSPYGWIANGQYWWTRSASSDNYNALWELNDVGHVNCNYYMFFSGVRPVLTISKETIRNF